MSLITHTLADDDAWNSLVGQSISTDIRHDIKSEPTKTYIISYKAIPCTFAAGVVVVSNIKTTLVTYSNRNDS